MIGVLFHHTEQGLAGLNYFLEVGCFLSKNYTSFTYIPVAVFQIQHLQNKQRLSNDYQKLKIGSQCPI